MKITRLSLSLSLLASCALALSATLPLAAAAGEKGAETLVRLTRESLPVAAADVAVSPASHARRCAMCTDSWATAVDIATKGPNREVKNVLRHNCATCDTKIMTEGFGKAKINKSVHSCGTTTAALCISH